MTQDKFDRASYRILRRNNILNNPNLNTSQVTGENTKKLT